MEEDWETVEGVGVYFLAFLRLSFWCSDLVLAF